MRKILFLFLINIFVAGSIFAQDKLSRVKIVLPQIKDQAFYKMLGDLEIDHFYNDDQGNIVAELGSKEMKILRKSGQRFIIDIDDVGKYLQQENERYYAQRSRGDLQTERMAMDGVCKTVNNIIQTPTAFEVKATFGGYYSFAEMNTAMNNLAAAYPALVTKTSIGKSIENRDIWAIKISDNVATDDNTEPDILYMGLQHAREAIGGSSMIFFMQYLCEQYALDPRIKSLVDSREIYIIPCVNPDGWEYNRTNPNTAPQWVNTNWRKNRRGGYGVDLNRNYASDWANCSGQTCNPANAGSCGSSSTSSDTYYGTSAFSEPETRAVRDFCYLKNFVAAIDQHAYGPYYSVPYGREFRTLTALESRFYTYVPALMGQYNGMRSANSCDALDYEVAGGVKDWWLIGDIGTGNKGKIWGMTGEGSAGGGVSGNNFWAPASQIVNLCKGMTFQNLQLAYAGGSYVDIQDVSDIAVTNLTGTFNFSLTRVGLENRPVTVSMVPIENIQTPGTPVTVASLPNYYDTYAGGINYTLFPALSAGQRISFAWKIETGDYVYYDTVTKFYSPVTIFSDDMEGASLAGKWTSSLGWNYSTDFRFQGTQSLSESPAANYPNLTTRIAQYAGPTINLTGATAAWVSFWVRHRAENFRDLLNVEVSADGTNWTAICGTTTVQEPGTLDGSRVNGRPALTGIREIWTRELFDLGNYLNTSNLRFRFNFSSNSNTSTFLYRVDQGFNIDNFKIVKTNAPLFNLLPVDFISFNGRLLPDETIKLDWDVAREINHDYFDVEKSTDGVSFSSIGKVRGIPPYNFVDKNPAEGNNFYRLRQVDKDSKFEYSNTIKVTYRKKDLSLSIYPNPVKDVLNIELNRNLRSKIRVTVTDITGRTYLSKEYNMTGQSNIIKLDVANWSRQQYIIKVMNENGETMAIEKFIK